MKKAILLCLFLTAMLASFSQDTTTVHTKIIKTGLSNTSIVRDSSGTIYPYDIWKQLVLTGYYVVKAKDPADKKTEFILIRLSEEEREKRSSGQPANQSSTAFITGEPVADFSVVDIDGNKYKLHDLKGTIVVLNFWFIECKPCRAEMPELNKLVQEYKDSTNVVFLAIALNSKKSLKKFLKNSPFNYTMIASGQEIADKYEVTSYPTHAIIDKEGKTYFHTTGLSSNTYYWLKRSIEEITKK